MDGFDFFAARANTPQHIQSNQLNNQYRMAYMPANQQVAVQFPSQMASLATNPASYQARPGIFVPPNGNHRIQEDPQEAAKRRQFTEQQRKMKDFSALTKTQIDADSYAKSLFGPFTSTSGDTGAKLNTAEVTPQSLVVREAPTSQHVNFEKSAQSIVISNNKSSISETRQTPSPAPVAQKKSLEEVMISMCDISAEPRQKPQLSQVVANKARGKERRQIPLWLTDEGLSSLPPFYLQLLQSVCAESADGLPIIQKVLSAFATLGVDYSRASSILLLTRRTLPNGQMTRHEFVEALALAILSKQGVYFSGVDHLFTLSSAPLPVMSSSPVPFTFGVSEPRTSFQTPMAMPNPTPSLPPITTNALPTTLPFVSTAPSVATIAIDDDFGDDFQSFQSADTATTTKSQHRQQPPALPIAEPLHPPPTSGDSRPNQALDRYAALRELETPSPEPEISLQPAFSVDSQTQDRKEAETIVSATGQTSVFPAFDNSEAPAFPKSGNVGDDDWADFSAASFDAQKIANIQEISPNQTILSSDIPHSVPPVPVKNQLGSLEADFTPSSFVSSPSKPVTPPKYDAPSLNILVSHDLDIWGDNLTSSVNDSTSVSVSSQGHTLSTASITTFSAAFSQVVPVAETHSQADLHFDNEATEKGAIVDPTSVTLVDNSTTKLGSDVSNYFPASNLVSIAKVSSFVNFDSLMEAPPDIAFEETTSSSPQPPQSQPSPATYEQFSHFQFSTTVSTEPAIKPHAESLGELDAQLFGFTAISVAPTATTISLPLSGPSSSTSSLHDQPVTYRESSPSLRGKIDTLNFETLSVSSLDLAKLPNDASSTLPDIFGTPVAPTSYSPAPLSNTPDNGAIEKVPAKVDDDFADFCRADSLTGQIEVATPEFRKLSLDPLTDSSKQSQTKTTGLKTIPSFSAFDDDIPETNVAPPLFSKSFTPLHSISPESKLLPVEIFSRCLKAACVLLEEAISAFHGAKGGEETVMEAMCTKRGRAFIASIREVREIVRRLKVALPQTISDDDRSLSGVLEAFVRFETIWCSLVDLLPQHVVDVLTNVSDGADMQSSSFQGTAAESQSTSLCAFCLGNLPASTPGVKHGPRSVVSLRTKRNENEQFHAVCANFWSNCVDPASSSNENPNIPSLASSSLRTP